MSRESSATSVNDAEHRRTRILNYGEHLMADSFGHAPTPTIRQLERRRRAEALSRDDLTDEEKAFWRRGSRQSGDGIQLGGGNGRRKPGSAYKTHKSPWYRLVTHNPIVARQQKELDDVGHFWPVAWTEAIVKTSQEQTSSYLRGALACLPLAIAWMLFNDPADTLHWLATPWMEITGTPMMFMYHGVRLALCEFIERWAWLRGQWASMAMGVGQLNGMSGRIIKPGERKLTAIDYAIDFLQICVCLFGSAAACAVELVAFVGVWVAFYPFLFLGALGWIVFGTVMAAVHGMQVEWSLRRNFGWRDFPPEHEMLLMSPAERESGSLTATGSGTGTVQGGAPPQASSSSGTVQGEAAEGQAAQGQAAQGQAAQPNNSQGPEPAPAIAQRPVAQFQGARRLTATPREFREMWLWKLRSDLVQLSTDPMMREWPRLSVYLDRVDPAELARAVDELEDDDSGETRFAVLQSLIGPHEPEPQPAEVTQGNSGRHHDHIDGVEQRLQVNGVVHHPQVNGMVQRAQVNGVGQHPQVNGVLQFHHERPIETVSATTTEAYLGQFRVAWEYWMGQFAPNLTRDALESKWLDLVDHLERLENEDPGHVVFLLRMFRQELNDYSRDETRQYLWDLLFEREIPRFSARATRITERRPALSPPTTPVRRESDERLEQEIADAFGRATVPEEGLAARLLTNAFGDSSDDDESPALTNGHTEEAAENRHEEPLPQVQTVGDEESYPGQLGPVEESSNSEGNDFISFSIDYGTLESPVSGTSNAQNPARPSLSPLQSQASRNLARTLSQGSRQSRQSRASGEPFRPESRWSSSSPQSGRPSQTQACGAVAVPMRSGTTGHPDTGRGWLCRVLDWAACGICGCFQRYFSVGSKPKPGISQETLDTPIARPASMGETSPLVGNRVSRLKGKQRASRLRPGSIPELDGEDGEGDAFLPDEEMHMSGDLSFDDGEADARMPGRYPVEPESVGEGPSSRSPNGSTAAVKSMAVSIGEGSSDYSRTESGRFIDNGETPSLKLGATPGPLPPVRVASWPRQGRRPTHSSDKSETALEPRYASPEQGIFQADDMAEDEDDQLKVPIPVSDEDEAVPPDQPICDADSDKLSGIDISVADSSSSRPLPMPTPDNDSTPRTTRSARRREAVALRARIKASKYNGPPSDSSVTDHAYRILLSEPDVGSSPEAAVGIDYASSSS